MSCTTLQLQIFYFYFSFFKSSINSRPRSIHEFIRDLLFISSAWFLEYTYSSLVCWFVSFFHLLCFLFFILTAPFTSSFHQAVRLFLVPPTYLLYNQVPPLLLPEHFLLVQSNFVALTAEAPRKLVLESYLNFKNTKNLFIHIALIPIGDSPRDIPTF